MVNIQKTCVNSPSQSGSENAKTCWIYLKIGTNVIIIGNNKAFVRKHINVGRVSLQNRLGPFILLSGLCPLFWAVCLCPLSGKNWCRLLSTLTLYLPFLYLLWLDHTRSEELKLQRIRFFTPFIMWLLCSLKCSSYVKDTSQVNQAGWDKITTFAIFALYQK